MFLTLFSELKQAGVPVSLREYLMLMEAMSAGVAAGRADDFYYLARAALVKDERHLDRFDRVFAHVFRGIEPTGEDLLATIPEEWLRKLTERFLTDEEKAMCRRWVASTGSWRSCASGWPSRRDATRVDPNGSAPAAPRPMAPMATTPPASASARMGTATTARSRCGTSGSSAISMIASSWEHATSRWP